jgi:hypothetical protein
MLPAKLDYLFVADFKDGSRYFQTPADASVVHPLTKSAFWDVLQRLDEVKQFTLTDRHRQHEHSVFLDDGHFTTDGRIIAPDPGVGPLHNFRLIYFRRCQQRTEGGFHCRPEIVAYFIGWQANDPAGKNFKMMLQIKPLGSSEPITIQTK